jgi:hypothetical protein
VSLAIRASSRSTYSRSRRHAICGFIRRPHS